MKKALTLMETLVATCVATMLLLEVGSSFLMFRQMNNESRTDAKNELKVLEIKDYITSNVDKFIDKALGTSYFRVDYNDVKSGAYKFVYDSGIYVIRTSGSGETVTLDVHKDLTINNESIVSFKLPEEYHDQPIYFLVDGKNKQVSKLSTDDTLYYSRLDDDKKIDIDVAEYKNNSLYINGEQIFTNLPFKNVSIKLGFEDNKNEVETYTVVEVKKGEYELLPFTIEVENPECGRVEIKSVDLDRHTVTLEAHNYYVYDDLISKINELKNNEEMDIGEMIEEIKKIIEGIGEVVEAAGDIAEGEIPSIPPEVYIFDCWEDDNGKKSDDFTYTIDYLNNPTKKYKAKFSSDTKPIDLENNLEESLKNTLHAEHYEADKANELVTKNVYILKCTIEYEDKNGVKTTLPFTAGLFEKYLPEIYRGEN